MSVQDHLPPGGITQSTVIRGSWVIKGISTGTLFKQEALEDGAIVVSGGLIRAIDRYRQIKKDFGHYPVMDQQGSILVPALVNGHCHLELSHPELYPFHRADESCNGDMTGWIRALLAARENFHRQHAKPELLILEYARKTLQEMYNQGVFFIGDVGNSLASRKIGSGQKPQVRFLLEVLGLTQQAEAKAFERLADIAADELLDIDCTPHAPYSTTPALIRAMKRNAAANGRILSIHVAESEGEVEFLKHGTGAFVDFLRKRGAWDKSFCIPAQTPIHYLDNLGILDSRTICVHCVHLAQSEIAILAARKAKVCLCPGSNRFLGVGRAPVTDLLDHGILPALGTDSRTSNSDVNIWREMRLLREDQPGLSPDSVFAMATYGGADAWGLSAEIGSLETGKKSLILAVDNKENADSSLQIFDFLTTAGESVALKWLN